jgi:hypothetical protein
MAVEGRCLDEMAIYDQRANDNKLVGNGVWVWDFG